jgi:hypothetical protein
MNRRLFSSQCQLPVVGRARRSVSAYRRWGVLTGAHRGHERIGRKITHAAELALCPERSSIPIRLFSRNRVLEMIILTFNLYPSFPLLPSVQIVFSSLCLNRSVFPREPRARGPLLIFVAIVWRVSRARHKQRSRTRTIRTIDFWGMTRSAGQPGKPRFGRSLTLPVLRPAAAGPKSEDKRLGMAER